MAFLTVELYPFFTWILYSLESTFHLKFTWISIIVCKKYGPNFWQSFCKLFKKVKKFLWPFNLYRDSTQFCIETWLKHHHKKSKKKSARLGIIEKIQKNLKHISTNFDLRSSYKKNYMELTFTSQYCVHCNKN